MLHCPATHCLCKKAQARLPKQPYTCPFQAVKSCLMCFYPSFVWELELWMDRGKMLHYRDSSTPNRVASFSVYDSGCTHLLWDCPVLPLVLASSLHPSAESPGVCRQTSWPLALFFRFTQELEASSQHLLLEKMWQSFAFVNCSREKKAHELASELLCGDMSSFSPQIVQLKCGWRGPLKLALFFWHGSVVKLGWFTVFSVFVSN